MNKKKLAVYTVLTGTKEPLGNPLSDLLDARSSGLDIAYYCITDNPNLTSDIWHFIYLDAHLILPPEKLSRHPKALPHHYFPNHDYSLFIDNIVKFKRLPQAQDLQPTIDADHLFKVYAHYHRTSIVEEALAIAGLKYDNVDVLANQLEFYQQHMSLDAIKPLTTGTVLLRQHHHPKVKAQGELWWLQILQFSKRDQMSFDFAVKQVGVKLSYFEGIKNDNPFIHKPNSMSGRVRSSFDAKKYQWINRTDSEAVANPKAHFLQQGANEHERYEVENEEVELLAYLAQSSLGRLVAPRRDFAQYLQIFFMRNAGLKGGAFFACFPSMTPKGLQYDQVESKPALQLLFSLAKRFGFTGDIDLKQNFIESMDFSQPFNFEKNYKMVVLLGYPISSLLHLTRFLSHLISKSKELKIFLSVDGVVDIYVLAWLKKHLSDFFEVKSFETMPSRHDALSQSISQSLLFIDMVKKNH